jgi:hypothetical protein
VVDLPQSAETDTGMGVAGSPRLSHACKEKIDRQNRYGSLFNESIRQRNNGTANWPN